MEGSRRCCEQQQLVGSSSSCPGLWEMLGARPSPTEGKQKEPKTRAGPVGQPCTPSTAALSCKGCFWHLSSSPAAFKNTELTWWPRALRFCNHTQSWSLSRAAASQASPHRLSLLGNQRFRGEKRKRRNQRRFKKHSNNQPPLPVHSPSVQDPAVLNPPWDGIWEQRVFPAGLHGQGSVPAAAWGPQEPPPAWPHSSSLVQEAGGGTVPAPGPTPIPGLRGYGTCLHSAHRTLALLSQQA